jgi:hypothetical protein
MATSFFELLKQMDAQHIVVAYSGVVDEKLLEAVYSMMDRHLEENKTPGDKRKKFFHVLVESLQNVFHHHSDLNSNGRHFHSGFIIKSNDNIYTIITGNHINSQSVTRLKEKLELVNSLSAAELRTHYQQSLAGAELSEKGGAGLGIIEMARKSGNKLKYEFTNVDNEYSFFTLEITI